MIINQKITDYSLEIKDRNGNSIYWENIIGIWFKRKFDANNNLIYIESSNGYWRKYQYDNQNKQIYFETSTGIIIDNRLNKLNNQPALNQPALNQPALNQSVLG